MAPDSSARRSMVQTLLCTRRNTGGVMRPCRVVRADGLSLKRLPTHRERPRDLTPGQRAAFPDLLPPLRRQPLKPTRPKRRDVLGSSGCPAGEAPAIPAKPRRDAPGVLDSAPARRAKTENRQLSLQPGGSRCVLSLEALPDGGGGLRVGQSRGVDNPQGVSHAGGGARRIRSAPLRIPSWRPCQRPAPAASACGWASICQRRFMSDGRGTAFALAG
jgi:hypothetical protein